MLLRRDRPPMLAEVPSRQDTKARPGSLSRVELEAFELLMEGVGEAKVVLVSGDTGRSAVALGLATVAVAGGRQAALVECDLAVPELARKVGLAERPGLHEYLREEAEASEILQPLALAGPASAGATAALVCVTAGAATAEGPTLLGSDGFRHALARMRTAYDLVVLDGPPFEADYSLRQVAGLVDVTIACVARPRPARRLPVPVAGLVIQR